MEEELDKEDDDISQEVVDECPSVVITLYTSNLTSENIALVLFTLPSGVTSCNVSLDPESLSSQTGGTDKVVVSYEWGEFSYNLLALFRNMINKNLMTFDHPKIQAIKRLLTISGPTLLLPTKIPK
eukprot:7381296-Ditylum_brightwellii.AAC.1